MRAQYAPVWGLTNGHSHKLLSEEMISQDLQWLLLCFVIFAVYMVTVLRWASHFFPQRMCFMGDNLAGGVEVGTQSPSAVCSFSVGCCQREPFSFHWIQIRTVRN